MSFIIHYTYTGKSDTLKGREVAYRVENLDNGTVGPENRLYERAFDNVVKRYDEYTSSTTASHVKGFPPYLSN